MNTTEEDAYADSQIQQQLAALDPDHSKPDKRRVFLEVARAAKSLQVAAALWRVVLVEGGEAQVLHVQGDAVAEDHHHKHRAEQGERQAYRIAAQLLALAHGHRQ